MDLASSTINFKIKNILLGIIISILFLEVIYQIIIYYSYSTQFNLDTKTIELYKKKVNNKSDCNVGIRLAFYYAEIKNNEKLAKFWMSKVAHCQQKN